MKSLPFEPVCFEHAAALIGKTAWDVSRDTDLLVQAHLAAIQCYRLTSCVVGMDIYNLEAEAYGASVLRPLGNGIPSLRERTFDSLEELGELTLDAGKGRIPLMLEAARRLRRAAPDIHLSIALSGPFTIATQLIGLEDMICELFSEPQEGADTLLHLAKEEIGLIQEIRAEGFGITVYESAVAPPLLSPDLFRNQVLPALHAALEAAGGTAHLIIGGNTLAILTDLLTLPLAYMICPVETDQQAFLQAMPRNWPGLLRVNLNPAVFLPGQEARARGEVERVQTLCATRSDLNLCCGTLLPYDADQVTVRSIAKINGPLHHPIPPGMPRPPQCVG